MTVSPRSAASRRGARSRARRAALDPTRLTKRQTQLLVFIVQFWSERGHSPNIAQMQAALGAGNEAWSQFTPSGSLTIAITNPAATGKLTPGKSYFLDFTEAQ